MSLPKIDDLALVGVEDPGDHREQRRLAAARGPDDQRHLAGVDVQSIPASAWTRWSPEPKCLVSPRIRTATSMRRRARVGLLATRFEHRRHTSHPSTCERDTDRLRPRRDQLRKTIAGSSRITRWTREQAGQHADQDDRHGRDRQELPGREEGQLARLPLQPSVFQPKSVDQPDADPVAEHARRRRLEQDHRRRSGRLDAPIALSAPNCLRFSIVKL